VAFSVSADRPDEARQSLSRESQSGVVAALTLVGLEATKKQPRTTVPSAAHAKPLPGLGRTPT